MEEELKDETTDVTDNNEIIEITDEENTDTLYDAKPIENPTPEKKKKKKSHKWANLSKRQKILIIGGIVLFFLIVIGLLLYFLVFKKEKTKPEEKPEVIVEKNNYRYEDGTLIFLDDNKKELGEYSCENKNETKCYVAYYNSDDDFDVTKRLYEDGKPLKESSDILNNRYVFIYDNKEANGGVKLYDLETKEIIGEYLGVKLINEFTLMVQDTQNKYGIISLKNEVNEEVDFTYDYLGLIPETDLLVAKTGKNSQLIDFSGKSVTKAVKGDIKNFDDNYLSVKDSDYYFLYDYNGNKVLSKSSDYLGFKNGYVLAVQEGKLYAYDENLDLLNYEGISLSSDNYVKKVIFNADNKEVERVDTFSVATSDAAVIITDGEEETKINAYEGKLSSKYANVSYYNGQLYIFADEGKTNLVATYKCSNPNEVIKTTTTFTNCFVAKESALLNRSVASRETGYLPIFNQQFVFINDTKDSKTDNIVLYDLIAKKSKVTYQAVDAGYYHKDELVGMEKTADRVIMARNTSGNYGLVKLENNNVTGLIAFQDENNGGATKSIKLMDNYYVVKRADNRYYLYPLTGGKKPIGSAASEIIGYQDGKAFKTLQNGTYGIVNLEGKIYNDGLVYAELFNNYYVTINQDYILNVYEYELNSQGLIKEDVKVEKTDNYASLYQVDWNAKQITINGVAYNIGTTEVSDEN